jgi:hypothetical protein
MCTGAQRSLLARRAARWGLIALAAPWLGACDSTIVVGTDCPPLRGVCVVDDGGSSKEAATPALDAYAPEPDASDPSLDGAADGAEPDAAEPTDAEVEAGPALFPPFQNPSFELQDGGTPGALAALDMLSPIAPWYACRSGLSVLSSARAGNEPVTPRAGDTFLGDTFPIVALNLNGVNQNFDPPLQAGQRYAFMVDLWSESGLSGGNLALEVGSMASDSCLAPSFPLARSELLPNGGWQSVCISFTPTRDVPALMLMVTAPEEYLNIGARLYLDDIRPEPGCP